MRPIAQMPYHLGLKVKIYPSNEQKRLIAVNDANPYASLDPT